MWPLVLTRKNAPLPGGHAFQPMGIISVLDQDIIGMNLLTKKNAPPLGSHHIQDIIGTNLLSKFHEDRKINVASTVLTRKNAPPPGGDFHEDQTINVASRVKNAPPLGSHVFQAKFHDDRKINVASRVLT
ncbi:hypothetical protein DPMN_037532, partial [Dreissena polymorpha]